MKWGFEYVGVCMCALEYVKPSTAKSSGEGGGAGGGGGECGGGAGHLALRHTGSEVRQVLYVQDLCVMVCLTCSALYCFLFSWIFLPSVNFVFNFGLC